MAYRSHFFIMPTYLQIAAIVIWSSWILLFPTQLLCDRIILKDGTVETSERVWESDKYVHFILEGTQTVEVRYAKEIVERIEKKDLNPAAKSTQIHDKTKSNNKVTPQPLPSLSAPMPAKQSYPKAISETSMDRGIIDSSRNISFYDPHRPKRYWASCNSQHATLKAAIEALSGMYGKPIAWVEANMGEENDLALIHTHLLSAIDSESEKGADQKGSPASAEPAFHDDSRPFAFQTGANRFFRSRDEALADLSEQYSQPVEWVVEHMGKTNILRDIHSNLANALSEPLQNPFALNAAANWAPLDIPKGINFYDPRREKKYWINPRSQYNTLQEALKALADEYGVSVQWIETHMGDTNLLHDIHQNIRGSLAQP